MQAPADIRTRLLLSVQRALLGAVPASLREVTCGWEDSWIKLRFVFDGEIAAVDKESAQIAATEVIADFSEPWMIAEEIVRIDHPADLKCDEGRLPLTAYRRRDPGGTILDALPSTAIPDAAPRDAPAPQAR